MRSIVQQQPSDDAGSSRLPRRDLAQVILRNTLAASAGGALMKLQNFLFMVYVVRLLGEVGLGRYATVVAFVGLFSVFFELGLAQYVERDIARDAGSAATLFWNLLLLRLGLAVVGIFGITGLAIVFGFDRGLVFGVFLFTLTFLFAAVLVPLTTLLTANERFDLSVALQLLNQILTVVAGLVLLWFGLGYYALLLTGFVTMPAQILLTIWTVRRHHLGPPPWNIHPGDWRRFIVASLPFGLTSLALTFNFNVDTVIIGLFHSDGQVGFYNAAYRLIFNGIGVVGGFLTVMTPSLAREFVHDSERVRRWVTISLHWMLLFSLPAATGLAMLAPRVIGLLYGPGFAASAPVLAILAWDIPLLLLNAFFGNVTAAVGLERPAARIYLGSAVVNLVLNLALIPTFGILAAAWVTIATDSISALIFIVLLRRQMAIHGVLAKVPKIGVATGLMVAFMLVADGLPLAMIIVAGATVFLVSSGVLRLYDPGICLRLIRQATRAVSQ